MHEDKRHFAAAFLPAVPEFKAEWNPPPRSRIDIKKKFPSCCELSNCGRLYPALIVSALDLKMIHCGRVSFIVVFCLLCFVWMCC
jgi:hypothetical protein